MILLAVFLFTFLLTSTLSLAVQYDASDYENLLSEANSKGFVRVLITIDDTVTLADMKSKRATLKTTMASKAQSVLTELGENALTSGYWNNNLGQIGVYVNEAGLHILAGSNNVIAFTRDITHAYRIKVADADDSLDAIESALHTSGSIDVEMHLNVDTIEYDIDRAGNTLYKPSPRMSAQAQAILDDLAKQSFAKGIKYLENDFSNKPSTRVNIDRVAYYGLIENDKIRAIRPTNHKDSRIAQWPEEVLEAAKAHGEAEIIISLRGGDTFSPKTGYMSDAAIKAQEKANQRAFDDILSTAGLSTAAEASAATNLSLGILHSRFNFESLAKLYDMKDTRILSIELNKPATETQLTNSTTLMNLGPAWAAGYRAAGQNLVIIDSGVRKDHALFTTNGVSRVTYEACFGTNVNAGGVVYSSICPNQNSVGDSPLGLSNSGLPNSNLTTCNALIPLGHDCSHGTHVAGIAAARQSNSVTPNTLQGVGPDASIVAVQVFSYNNTVPKAGAFDADMIAALTAVKNATTTGVNNPFTVNMSIGSSTLYSQSAGSCNNYSPAMTTVISDLNSRGVPIVVATGNNSNKSNISWPACVSQAIKVSAVSNDASGTTLAGFANIGTPANFIGPILLAPGGSSSTTVLSADRATTTATKSMAGTSQATPHVAAYYAAVKAANANTVSVADITAWVITTGSFSVTYTLPSPTNTQSYRRVRAP